MQIITTFRQPSSHPKWWFNKGTSPKSPKHSGLGIILICNDDDDDVDDDYLTWPMAKRLKLFGITYLVGKIKFKLFFQGPLAK